MKSLIKFIIFIIYILSIFVAENYFVLAAFFVLNLTFSIILKINIIKWFKNCAKFGILVLITVTINILLVDLNSGINIGIKLFLTYMGTYVFSSIFSYIELAKTIETILYPFKLFGINPKNIGISVCIAIVFIPILANELEKIKEVFIAKGIEMKTTNLVKNLSLIFNIFFISLFERVSEIEYALKSKAYQE